MDTECFFAQPKICAHRATRPKAVTAHEWAHFREAERSEFFISDDLLWILYVFPWLGLALASLYNRRGSIKWIGFIWGLLATLPWLAITWSWKIRQIRKSLEQCPPDAYSNLGPRSLFPWKSGFKTKGESFRKL
jgi:hypothetical protein